MLSQVRICLQSTFVALVRGFLPYCRASFAPVGLGRLVGSCQEAVHRMAFLSSLLSATVLIPLNSVRALLAGKLPPSRSGLALQASRRARACVQVRRGQDGVHRGRAGVYFGLVSCCYDMATR